MFGDNGFIYQFAEFLRKAGDVNLSYDVGVKSHIFYD